jgi:hypothetical protein
VEDFTKRLHTALDQTQAEYTADVHDNLIKGPNPYKPLLTYAMLHNKHLGII